jgi:hypothetical protein
MTWQMPKVRQAALLLLDAGFDHLEVARLFGMTDSQVRLSQHKDESEDGQRPAVRGRAKLLLRSISTHCDTTAVRACERDVL